MVERYRRPALPPKYTDDAAAARGRYLVSACSFDLEGKDEARGLLRRASGQRRDGGDQFGGIDRLREVHLEAALQGARAVV